MRLSGRYYLTVEDALNDRPCTEAEWRRKHGPHGSTSSGRTADGGRTTTTEPGKEAVVKVERLADGRVVEHLKSGDVKIDGLLLEHPVWYVPFLKPWSMKTADGHL